MRRLRVSICAGAASGGLTAAATFPWLARTAAFAMPRSFNLHVWDVLVVFGVGATLVAFPLMLLGLRLVQARGAEVATVLGAALLALVAGLAVAGALPAGGGVLLAWAVGLALAALVHRFWRPSGRASLQAHAR